jgi:hypothetical protein
MDSPTQNVHYYYNHKIRKYIKNITQTTSFNILGNINMT